MSLSSRVAAGALAAAVACASLTFTSPAAADGPAGAPPFYRLVRQVPMRKEAVIPPSLVKNRLADVYLGAGKPAFRKTMEFSERLLESARRQVAPKLPSRGESTFMTPASSVAYWRTQISAPTLVEVRPVDPKRVTTRDVAHLDRLVAFVGRAFTPETTAPERADLLRKAHAAAVDYWTKEPAEGAHVETLAGGGAVYVRRAPSDPAPQSR